MAFSRYKDTAADASEQIAQLREQVEMLMNDRITPALADAAGRAESTLRESRRVVQDQAEALGGRVRRQPMMALLIAAGAGYLIGRVLR